MSARAARSDAEAPTVALTLPQPVLPEVAPAGCGPGPPGPPRRRLRGLDAGRGAALVALVTVHTWLGVDVATPTRPVATTVLDRAVALLVVASGIGVVLLTGRRRVRADADGAGVVISLLVRGALVAALGLALGELDVGAVAAVIPALALVFLAATPLVLLGRRTLLILAAVSAGAVVATAPVSATLAAPLPGVSLGVLAADPGTALLDLALTGHHPVAAALPLLCLGMALGRLDPSSARTAAGMLAAGIPCAVAAALAATPVGAGVLPALPWAAVLVELVGGAGTALVVLGLVLLADHVTRPVAREAVAALVGLLAALGGLVLTLYTAHVLFLVLGDRAPVTGLALQGVVAVLFALGWRATAGRGPLESVVTVLSRRAARPVSRSSPTRRSAP